MGGAHTFIQEQNDYPWLIFKVANQSYALQVQNITAILNLPEQIEAYPDAPVHMRGIFDLRGHVAPLIDLRVLFGFQTLACECEAFTEMLEQRKQDHLEWVEALELSVEEGAEFLLTTDPHACAFGQWYDTYVPQSDSVRFFLGKMDEPHQKLHYTALEVKRCREQEDLQLRQKGIQELMGRLKNEYVPQIVLLLEEAKSAYLSSTREMVVVLGEGDRQVGMIVDEVLAVEHLSEEYDGNGMFELGCNAFISGVAGRAADKGMVLRVDGNQFMGLIGHSNQKLGK